MIKSRKFSKGIRTKPTTDAATLEGEQRTDSADNKQKIYLDGAERAVVTEDQSQTLQNKTIDSANNIVTIDADEATVENLEVDNLKAGVLNTDLSGPATDSELPSALAVKTALEGQNEASEIEYNPAGNPETSATNLQDALDDTGTASQSAQTDATQALSDAASAQTDIDNHILDTIAHGATGAVMGTTNTQTMRNKTIDGSNRIDGLLNRNTQTVNTGAVDITFSPSEEVILITGSATGIAGMSTLTDAPRITIINKTGSSYFIRNESLLPVTADQRIVTGTGSDVEIAADGTAIFQYNDTDQRWHMIGGAGGVVNAADVVFDNSSNGFTATDTQDAIEENNTLINDHIADATDAHDASAISTDNSGNSLTSTDAQASFTEIAGRLDTNDTLINANEDLINGLDAVKNINHIDNSDAELNTNGWTNYRNTTDGELPDDFGGTPDPGYSGLSRNNIDPLRGVYSFTLDLTMAVEADAQGHGAYAAFSVPDADLAKKHIISFDYDFDHASYSDGDIKIFVYDVDKSQLIRVNGEDVLAGKGTHYAQFQTDATSSNYRLVFHYAGTSKNFSVKFDRVFVSPQKIAYGTIVTDWEEFTPTGSWNTNVTYSGKYRRVGDSIELEYFIETSGAPNTGAFGVNLPDGLSIDFNKIESSNEFGLVIVGDAISRETGVGAYPGHAHLRSGTSEDINITYISDPSAGSNPVVEASVDFNSPFVFGSGDIVYVKASVPIQGWSSNAKMSEDFGGRDIIVVGQGNGAGSLTANVTNIDFTETKDTTSSWDGSIFTAPETGTYIMKGSVRFASSVSTSIYLYIDGVNNRVLGTSHSQSNGVHDFMGVFELNKGEQASLRTTAGATLSNNTTDHWIHIQKLASPQTILENETVAARYTSNSGQSIPTASNTIVVYEDLDKDTHNAYNTSTGVYTVPVTGWYNINSKVTFSGLNVDAGEFANIRLTSSVGSLSLEQHEFDSTNSSKAITLSISDLFYLEKGETLNVQTYHNTGSSENLLTNPERNTFSIARIK